MKRLLLVFVLLFYCFCLIADTATSNAPQQASSKYYLTASEQKFTWFYQQPKSYGVALALSLIPGGGHFYYNENGWGLLYLGVEGGLIASSIPCFIDDPTATADINKYNKGVGTVLAISAVIVEIAAIVHLWFINDVYQRQLKENVGLVLAITVNESGIGVGIHSSFK